MPYNESESVSELLDLKGPSLFELAESISLSIKDSQRQVENGRIQLFEKSELSLKSIKKAIVSKTGVIDFSGKICRLKYRDIKSLL